MKLLTIEAYVAFFKTEFAGVDPELLEGLFLERTTLDTAEIAKAEQQIGLGAFPSSFVNLIKHYDFGNFRIINTQFGYDDTGALDWLVRYNDVSEFGHEAFRKEAHAQSLLIVANGDPFTILLDIQTGQVFAVTAEQSVAERILVSTSFEHFIQGMGTGFLAKRTKKADEFLKLAIMQFGEVALSFWKEATL